VNSTDEKKILRILQEVYTLSMYTGPEGPQLADEFHPDFQILIPELDGRTGEVADVHWLRPTPRARPRPITPASEMSFDCSVLDAAGKSAVGKVEVHRGGRLVCTDYVLFFKVARQWRVVGKIYHQHGAIASRRN
jgi:hypothetical protein